MRKKQHKKLNPQDKEYDKYYVINYLVRIISCDPAFHVIHRKWANHGWKYKLKMMAKCQNLSVKKSK